MDKKKICILGCGTYGSYLLGRFLELADDQLDITVVDIGDRKIKSEKEIGIASQSSISNAPHDGRYFGLGGTSARWGGQVLFFDERDNPQNDTIWQKIISINNTYRASVIKYLLNNSAFQNIFEAETGDIKVGIWLKYNKRNLFNKIKASQSNKVKILQNLRIVDFEMIEDKITKVVCKNKEGVIQTIEADVFYLTAGAIESCRLLLGLNDKYHSLDATDLGKSFGDHLSVELFKIQGSKPVINGSDLLPSLISNSLITKRVVTYAKNGNVGYLHPIFNKEVAVFSSIKQLLFGKEKVSFAIKDIFVGVEFLIRFAFSVFVLRKMYAHRNNWSLQLDIEQSFPNNNRLYLSNQLDSYGEKQIAIDWQVSDTDKQSILDIKETASKLMEANNLPYFDVLPDVIPTDKIEDIYHPVGFMRLGDDEKAVLDTNARVKNISNLYHFSTAMFPSAKSINPTAAAFCFIEHHINRNYNN
jgi:hypothetical protein